MSCMQNMSQTNSKKWRITESENRPIKDGKYVISNILSEYQVLCVKNGNVELGTYAGTEEQIFNISYVGMGIIRLFPQQLRKHLMFTVVLQLQALICESGPGMAAMHSFGNL